MSNEPWMTNPSLDVDLSSYQSTYLDGTGTGGTSTSSNNNNNNNNNNNDASPTIEQSSYITRTTDSNGPCSNDGSTNWADRTQPCPGATITYQDILGGGDDDVEFSTSGSEDISSNSLPLINPHGDDGSNNDGGGDDETTKQDQLPFNLHSTTLPEGGVDNFNDGSDIKVINGMSYPSYYSCTSSEINLGSSSKSTGKVHEEVPIAFNYEVYTTTDGGIVEEAIGTFERQLAHGVASSLGLVDCITDGGLVTSVIALRSNSDTDNDEGDESSSNTEVPFAGVFGGGGGNRRSLLMRGEEDDENDASSSMGEEKKRMLASGSSSSSTVVVGISMNPVDRVATEIETCTSTVTLSSTSSTTSCTPIAGAMTAWLTTPQRRQLRQLSESTQVSQETLILNSVQSYIEQHEDSYLNENLLHVSYIDARSSSNNEDGVNLSIKSTEANNGMNPGYIGIAVAAVVVLVGLAGVLYKRRRQRCDSSRRTSQEADPSNDMGSFPHAAGLTPESHSNRSSTADTNEIPDGGDGDSRNLFGLTGARSDDDDDESSMEEGNMMTNKHSSLALAALGAASTLVASRYSPTCTPNDGEQDVQESNSFDMTPVSPQEEDDDDEDEGSSAANISVFDSVNDSSAYHIGTVSEDAEQNDVLLPGQAISPSESTVHISNESGVFAGAAVPMPHEDYSSSDDEDEPGLV